MPEFEQNDLMSWQSINIHFATMADREEFAKLIGRKLTHRTRSIWYPREEIGHFADRCYSTDPDKMPHYLVNPRYPVYVISKGRWKSRKTSRELEKLNIPYQIVVEPQEYKNYAKVIDPKKILQLPRENYGGGCSIPARNWVWNHSRKRGADRHWILDDNIEGFYRLNRNLKTPVNSGAIFRAAEDFTDRHTNVAISGFNYFMFAPRKSGGIEPYTLNTRVYSCILLSNTLKNSNGVFYEWRGRYNEDTDLSIRMLKDGWCSILFNAFLAFKATTMTMKGGNTESLYQGDGRKEMAISLRKQHPDIVKITHKWGRWQHHVDYSGFKRNKLKERPNLKLEKKINNYGMVLEIDEEKRKKMAERDKKIAGDEYSSSAGYGGWGHDE